MKVWMPCDEQLGPALSREFKSYTKNGINEFIKHINFEDPNLNSSDLFVTDDTDIIWCPGAYGDISPCTVLELKEFEKKHNIGANDKRLYIVTDPVLPNLSNTSCDDVLYDIATKDSYIGKPISLDKIDVWPIYIGNNEKLVSGYYVSFTRNSKEFHIIYLQMTLENFLFRVIFEFKFKIKWLFFLNMQGSYLFTFQNYASSDIDFPEWICANRVGKYEFIKEYADLKLMTDGDTPCYFIDNETDPGSKNVFFGRMVKPKSD